MKKKIIFSFIFSSSLLLLFTFTSSVNAEQGQAYIVGTDHLNVRSSPDSHALVIGKLMSGQELVGFQEKHGWVQTYYDGKEAWVASHYLIKKDQSSGQSNVTAPSKEVMVNANGVRLRNGPSTNHSIITHASEGDMYQLIETNGDWHYISLANGSTAWVFSSLTTDMGAPKQSPPVRVNKSSEQVTESLAGYTIILDAGHGGNDPGAFSLRGEKEKDFTLTTTHIVAETLRSAGATVVLTRSGDTYLSLRDRVSTSEIYNADAFLSIHYNAHTSGMANGASTHYSSNQAKHLAESIQAELNKEISMNNRGVRHDAFYVLRENRNLSVLVELGFLSNDYDLSQISSAHHSNDVARAIEKGLINYFNSY